MVYLSALLESDRFDTMGTVTGVDISRTRLSTCRSLLKRYHIRNARLFLADGTEFCVGAPTLLDKIATKERKDTHSDANEENKSKNYCSKVAASNTSGTSKPSPFFATKLLRSDPQYTRLYDRVSSFILRNKQVMNKVIVDAECTHDGSIAHLLKYSDTNEEDSWSWSGFDKNFMDTDRLSNLQHLQRSLLQNGFNQLRPGGVLVYSTCSFSAKQNEEILLWFLAKNSSEATLEPVSFEDKLPRHSSCLRPRSIRDPIFKELIPYVNDKTHLRSLFDDICMHTLRFDGTHLREESDSGRTWWTSGLFIARITKLNKG